MLVSIVMPARNAERTIRQAVQSVLTQTYTEWELIIIDDASVDDTAGVIQKMIRAADLAGNMASGNRIRVIRNERNLGVAGSRNRGVQAANGAWVAFLDSDDMWHSDKLRKQMELAARETDADIIYTGSSFIQNDGTGLFWTMCVPETMTYKKLLKQNVIACSSVIMKRELALRYPMVQNSAAYGEMHEDYPVWLQVLKHGGHACGLNEPLLIYRLSEDSRSGNKIRAAAMTYRVYRYIGLGTIRSIYYFGWYAARNMRKYYRLYS